MKVFLLLLLCSATLQAETFRFQYTANEKYRIVTEVDENVYVDGQLSHRANILNKIAVETQEVRDGAGLLSCSYQTSERASGVITSFALSEDYHSLFWRDQQGNYEISPQYFMPVVRDVPIFPDRDLQPGDTWSARGEEVHDLRRSYGIQKAFHFPIRVNYTYTGQQERDGRDLAVIEISYSVFYRVQGLQNAGRTVPARITGRSDQVYYWDNDRGKPYLYEEEFDFIFHLNDGRTVEYEGTAQGKVLDSPKMDRQATVEELQQEIAKRGIEDASVKAEERGITLTLDNIQFPPDSDFLWDTEKRKLRQIGDLLRNYSERDILVTGHTARVSGYTERDFKTLSQKRAAVVADYLLSLGAVGQTQIMTRGQGADEPLASNSNAEGRRINRRVEITILEN